MATMTLEQPTTSLSSLEIVAEVHSQPSTRPQPGPLCFRQGDVLFTRIAVLPDEPLAVRESDVIVASTHTHRLREGHILEDATGTLFLDVPEPTQVVHAEHQAVSLPPGIFQVTRQRQYTPEAIRMVWD